MLPLILLVLAAPKGATPAAPARPSLPSKAAVFSTDSAKEGELKSALEGADVPLVNVADTFPVPAVDDSGVKLAAAAKQLYDDLDYEASAAKWNEALEFFVKNPDAADSKSMADSHFFIAVLAIQNGGKSQAKKAQEEFARALLFNPELTCDPQVYGNDVKKAFDKAMADVNGRPTAKLSIDSNPAGADIQVRGKKMGQTPFTDGATVPIGRHLVTLSKPGYGVVGVFADVSREGGSVKPELKAAGEYAGVIDGATNAIGKGVGQKGPLPGNAHKIGEVVKARFLVMSDGSTAEVWDVDTGNRLAGLSLSGEELSVTAKKISDFIAKPGNAAVASAKKTGGETGVEEPGAMGPVYKQWWFWTAVGVVAVGAGTAVGVAAANNSGPRPYNVVLGLP